MMIKEKQDILKYKIEYGVEFSEMDTKSRDKLISEICKRILKLEEKLINLNYTPIV